MTITINPVVGTNVFEAQATTNAGMLEMSVRGTWPIVVAALGKQYVAGKIDGETMRGRLCAIGLTDEVDADRLTWALDTIREYGAALPSEPATSNGKASDEAATDAQWTLVRKLAGEKKQPIPDGPLTKAQAHEIIDALKAGTYDAGKWTVPF